MYQILINAFRETLYMVLTAGLFTILIGIPLGMLIANIGTSQNRAVQVIYYISYTILTTIQSIPYLLLMLLFIPTTNWMITKNISYTTATILPLTVAGALMLAQKSFIITKEILANWQATTKSMTLLQINNQQNPTAK